MTLEQMQKLAREKSEHPHGHLIGSTRYWSFGETGLDQLITEVWNEAIKECEGCGKKEIKVYKVSGDDYSALSFREHYRGKLMSDVAKELGLTKQTIYTHTSEEHYYDVQQFGVITDEKSFNVAKELQDYDDSKHTDLILENEII